MPKMLLEKESTVPLLKLHIPVLRKKSFFLEEFVSYMRIQGLTLDTQSFYLSYINRFIQYSWFESIECFDNLLKLKVSYNNLPKRNISNNTIDKYYKAIKKYSLFLLDSELITNKYFLKLQKVKINKSLPKSLSQADIEKINDYILSHYQIDFYRYRNYTIFQTLLNTGIRRNELVHLRKEDIFSQYIKINNGKWNKDRLVYITREFSKLIQDYLKIQTKSKEYVFSDYHWNKLDRDALSQIFTRIRRITWIYLSPHLLRHTYASLCVKKWINLYTLQQQMGHTDLKTTSIYLYLNSKENWEEIQKLSL